MEVGGWQPSYTKALFRVLGVEWKLSMGVFYGAFLRIGLHPIKRVPESPICGAPLGSRWGNPQANLGKL